MINDQKLTHRGMQHDHRMVNDRKNSHGKKTKYDHNNELNDYKEWSHVTFRTF